VPEVNAILAFQQPDKTVMRLQVTGRALVKIKAAILVKITRVVGVAHVPVPLAEPDDRFPGATFDL